MCLCFVKPKLCTGSPNCNGILFNHTIELYILDSDFPLSLSDNIIYIFSTLALLKVLRPSERNYTGKCKT